MPVDLREKARARLAREHGGVAIDRAAPVRFALAFPNVYSLGMASLGYQLVYEMLNANSDASCERVFLPDPEDLTEHERSRTELFTLESLSPLSEFDVIGFSISYELDYINVLRMLRLANIPLRRRDRDETRPLIIAGGPCATFNPEPLAEFVDAFAIGDSEELLPRIVEAVKSTSGGPREETLAALAQVPGIYVPHFYNPQYGQSGRLAGVDSITPAPPKVLRSITANLASYPAGSTIRTSEGEFGEILLLEVIRGCGRHCRFCAAGYVTRPPWAREIGDVPDRARLGLVGAAVFDHPEAEDLCQAIVDSGTEFSVSSVRLETVTPAVAALMARGGQKTLTIAPEAGTQRLRTLINKPSTEDDMRSAISAAHQAGIDRVRMYFMIGLPTETDADAAAIADLVCKLAKDYPSVSFQVSVSCFVPKPWTPFQWAPMERESVLRRRFVALKRAVLSIGGVKFTGESPRLAIVQGYLARGDRRLADVIEAAMLNGGDYPAALRETGVDVSAYVYRARDEGEALPWDHVDIRVKKTYLWMEYQRALTGELTGPCRLDECTACGACTSLNDNPQPVG
jgi:radical SAM superfamily enzyme YgiQ (UPF0313 family)